MSDSEDHMAGGSTVRSDDLAVTNNRVSTLERGVRDLAEDQHRMAKDLTSQITAVSTSFSSEIKNVSTNLSAEIKGVAGSLAERSKVPWQALGVMLAFVTGLGTLVYWPIKDNQLRFETHLLRIAEQSVTQKELDQRFLTNGQRRDDWQRASEERYAANKESIDKLRENIVPRWMHDEKWRVSDKKIDEIDRALEGLRGTVMSRGELDGRFNTSDTRMSDLQRQLDKQDKMFGDTYNLKDVVSRILRKQDELESEVRKAITPSK